MSRIDAIVCRIREELEARAGLLDSRGLYSLNLMCYFEGDTWRPRDVVIRPEFTSRAVERTGKRA